MHIAVVGSGFVRGELLRGYLAEQFPDATFSILNCNWPVEPFMNDDEIQEYGGDPEAVATLAESADLLVVDVAPVTAAVIERARRLRAIGVGRGGPVNVNVAAATRRRIPVLNAPGRNATATAEFTVALLLAGMRRLCRGHMRMQQGEWDGSLYLFEETGQELEGKTAGVIGLGNVGSRVARILRGFGMKIVAHDPWAPPSAFMAVGAESVDLPTLLRSADVLTLHARVSAANRRLIGAAELAQLRRGAFVVNAARGSLLDYEALYSALESGHLSGAALDVYDPEPFPLDHPLLRHPRITVAPHIAGATRESAIRGARAVAEDLGRLMRKEQPRFCMNPQVLA